MHLETTLQTLLSQLEDGEINQIEKLVAILRWRIRYAQTTWALDTVRTLFDFAMRIRGCTFGGNSEAAASRVLDLKTYLNHTWRAVAHYGHLRQQGKAVSTLRAEGLVNEIANSRMGKRQRMRWSPKGAHRLATVRAAVLNGELSNGHLKAT